MFGQEGEELNNWRKQNGPIYAEELKRQIEEKNRKKIGLNSPAPTFMDPKPVQKLLPEPERIIQPSIIAAPSVAASYDPQLPSKYNYDRIVSIEIPSRIKPCEDKIATVSTKLDTWITSYQDNFSSLKDRVSEIQSTVSSSTQMVNGMNEYFKSITSELSQKVIQSASIIENQNAKIASLEAKVSKMEEAVVFANQKSALLETQVSDSISKLNSSMQQMDAADQSAHSTLFQIIHNLQQKMANAVKDLQAGITSIQPTFNANLSSLAKETKEALEQVRNENNSQIEDMRKNINAQSKESANAFGAFQDEVVQTIQALSNSVNLKINSILSTMTDIAAAQPSDAQQNEKMQKILETAAQSIANPPQEQISKEEIKSIVKESVDKYGIKLKDEIGSYLNATGSVINDYQSRITNLEMALKNMQPKTDNNDISDQIGDMEKQYENWQNRIYEHLSEMTVGYDDKIDKLTKNQKRVTLFVKSEILKMQEMIKARDPQINVNIEENSEYEEEELFEEPQDGEFKPTPPHEPHYIRVRIKKRKKHEKNPLENPPTQIN